MFSLHHFGKSISVIINKLMLAFSALVFSVIFIYNLNYIFNPNLQLKYLSISSVLGSGTSALLLKAFIAVVLIIPIMYIISPLLMRFSKNQLPSRKKYIILLVAVAFLLRLIWIISVETKPISDYDLLYKAAKAINSGNFNYIKGIEYFQQWVYQLGFVVYQTLILKIFGEGYVVLKLLNVLFSVGTCVLVYLTAAKVFNENVGRIAGLAYAIYIESIYMCSVLTNQILASFLFYLALYLAICGARKYTFILVGVFIAIGNAIRPEGPVIIASIAVFYLLFRGSDSSGETDVQKGHFKSILKSLLHRSGLPVGVIIVFFIVTQVFSFAIVHTGVSDYPLTNRNPLWKFVLGFNHQSGGMYNPKDDNYISKYPIGPERDAQEKKLIIERTKDKKKLVRLFFTKFKTMWADFDHSFINFVTPGTTLTPNKIKLVAYTEKINYTLMILFIIISLISIYMNKERFRSYHPLLIMVLGFIFIHIFIEVQLRYRYLVLPSFFIIGSYGIYVSAKYIVKLKPVLPIINVKKTS